MGFDFFCVNRIRKNFAHLLNLFYIFDMFFENVTEKYILGSDWILRNDINYVPNKRYSLYNVNTQIILYLSRACYTIFSLFTRNAFSFVELQNLFIERGVHFDWDGLKRILEQEIASNLLIPFENGKKYSRLNTPKEIISKVPITSTPLSIELHFTHKCNLKCLHCFQESSPLSDKFNLLKPVEWINVFEQIEKARVQNVTISGGEPLYYPHFSYLFSKIVNKKINYTILTNALLVNSTNAFYLSKPNVSLSISLDGFCAVIHERIRGKGTFDKAIENIRLLVSLGAKVALSYTLNQYNYQTIDDYMQLAISLGVKGVVMAFTDSIGRAKNNEFLILSKEQRVKVLSDFERVRLLYKDRLQIDFADLSFLQNESGNDGYVYCSAATSRAAIDSFGIMYPCVMAFGDRRFMWGDLKTEKLEDVWANNKMDLFRGDVLIDDLSSCKICELRKQCTQKNCRLKSLLYSSDFYAKPIECPADFNLLI